MSNRVVYFKTYKTWFQHFKRASFPKWLLKLFPIQYKKITRVVEGNNEPEVDKEHAWLKTDNNLATIGVDRSLEFLERLSGSVDNGEIVLVNKYFNQYGDSVRDDFVMNLNIAVRDLKNMISNDGWSEGNGPN